MYKKYNIDLKSVLSKMLNSDVLGCIFFQINDPQTVLNFVSCSQSTYRIAQKFAQLKRQQLTHITTQQLFPVPGFTFITTIYPSGWSETRNELGLLYKCGKIKNGKKQGLWKEWDIYGNLIEEAVYLNGVKNGFCKSWDTTDDGKQGISISAPFNNGQPDGLCRGLCFPFYFAWFDHGERKWLLIGLIKRFWSTILNKLLIH